MTSPHAIEQGPDRLRALIDAMRAYSEVVREPPGPGGGSAALGTITLRVWGLLLDGREARTLGEACWPTVAELRRLALAVAAPLQPEPAPEFEPFQPVFYESRQSPGRDEINVSLTFRSRAPDGELVRQLKARLKVIGLGEGQWHRAVTEPHP